MTARPAPSEYAPYFEKYVSLVPDGELRAILAAQPSHLENLLAGLTEQQALHAYAPGKWSIKELVGHVIDTERVFAYRALWIARNGKAPLPGFEQDVFAASTRFNDRPLPGLLEEFAAVRKAGMFLFSNLSEEAWQRRSIVNANEMSTRAAAYIAAGHPIYHMEILKSRYL
jgi:hypothetical protein